ncbi:MAG TPA: VOC family protein, partial [Steroidobacteraceae bacterium]|nr:VOC family protein [Steroidobacteraceae bacterium]
MLLYGWPDDLTTWLAAPERLSMPLSVKALDHIVINVSDVERSAEWYQRVLGMTREDFVATSGQPKRTAL